ncbi:hypothetical protein K435DRAFT_844261 [Dendrothele bispora CBS 962.96]|uniref:Uncharacterized protein n=1 Tax=Dendrothele bispora (strain CBS 962.96) TaxID=1314807 RepID=A0A4S8L3C2_DENBC|nr:hypothetical protein K435DRAFT_844261 [Dendrothele bispora CBS 962.96]
MAKGNNDRKPTVQKRKTSPNHRPELAKEVTSPRSVASSRTSSSGSRAQKAPSDDNVPGRSFDGARHARPNKKPENGSGEPPARSDGQDNDNVGGIFNKAYNIKFLSGGRGNKIVQIGGESRPVEGFNGASNIDFDQFNFSAVAESDGLLRHYEEAHDLTFKDIDMEFNGKKKTPDALVNVPNAQGYEQRAKQNYDPGRPGMNLTLQPFAPAVQSQMPHFITSTTTTYSALPPGAYILILPADHANPNAMPANCAPLQNQYVHADKPTGAPRPQQHGESSSTYHSTDNFRQQAQPLPKSHRRIETEFLDLLETTVSLLQASFLAYSQIHYRSG